MTDRIQASRFHPLLIWASVAGLLIILHLCVAGLSRRFEYGSDLLSRPIPLLVGIEVLTGIVFLILVSRIRNTSNRGLLFSCLLPVGILLRVIMFFSTPIQEDDFYRYLWDGAVLANGTNPFAYAPRDVVEGNLEQEPAASTLAALADDSVEIIGRINHPSLRTIYPPIAQLTFALAHVIKPWSLLAWRLVLFGFDLAALLMIIVILRQLGFSPLWAAVYWWNPIMLKEIYNSAHLDVITFAPVLLGLFLAARGRYLWSVLFLALAVGTKVWPILLLPVVLRPVLSVPRRMIPALLLFVFIVVIVFLPVYSAGLDRTSGFTEYGRRWEMNDALYMVFRSGSELVLAPFGGDSARSHLLARGIIMAVLVGWIVWCIRKYPERSSDFYERGLFIIAALFFLSPTQFPWYYTWLLPFLAIRPRWSLLLLTALLPLYYLRFLLSVHDRVSLFDHGIVWIEYGPVWLLLAREWYRDRRGQTTRLTRGASP